MTAKQIASVMGLGFTVMTVCYMMGLLWVTDVLSPPDLAPMIAQFPSTVPARPIVAPPQPEPSPNPTTAPDERFSVTDPRAVALSTDDVPGDFKIKAEDTHYVDNARLLENSSSPDQVEAALRASGRLNGFQIAFASEDPAASQTRSAGLLSFSEVYAATTDADRALLGDVAGLVARFPQGSHLVVSQESPPTRRIGRQARSFEGLLVTEGDRVPVHIVIFCRKNALTGVALLGVQNQKLVREGEYYAWLLDRRIGDFGKGLSA